MEFWRLSVFGIALRQALDCRNPGIVRGFVDLGCYCTQEALVMSAVDGAPGPVTSSGSNGMAKMLSQLNLPTLALILLTGGGNFFATKENSTDRDHQFNQAFKQIADLHEALDDTEKSQRTALDNQTRILEHDTVLLKEVHEIATKLENLRRLDQMRGAPE
jgi:hypothetical protein